MPHSDRIARSPDGASLEALLAQVALGSRPAFESLYQQTANKLFGVCLRVLSERAEAEDALQEVFATVWSKAGQFDAARGTAGTWLAMIARNKAIDRLRERPDPGKLAPIETAGEVEDSDPSPQQHALAGDARRRLESCLQRLDARRRALIHAAFFDGSTYEQLATRTGSPLGSIKSWIRRGLIQLRACLEQ